VDLVMCACLTAISNQYKSNACSSFEFPSEVLCNNTQHEWQLNKHAIT